MPRVDGKLANQHSHSASSKTSQNPKNGRDNDEAHNSVKGTFPSLVELVTEVRGTVVAMGAVRASLSERHAVKVAVVVVRHERRRRRNSVGTALPFEHSNNALFGRSEHTADALNQEPSQTFRVTTTLSPGFTIGGLLNVGSGYVKSAFGVVNEGDGNGVQRNRVAIKVEDRESNFHHVKRLLPGRWEGHHFDGIAQRDGFGFFAIFDVTLDSRDGGRRSGREDLMVVGQKKAVIDSELKRLRN